MGAVRVARRHGSNPVLVLAATILCGSCAPASVQIQETVTCFVESVQDQDGERWLGCAADDLARSTLGTGSTGSPEERQRTATNHLQAVARAFIEQRSSTSCHWDAAHTTFSANPVSKRRRSCYAWRCASFTG
jgi:hypothetical protein